MVCTKTTVQIIGIGFKATLIKARDVVWPQLVMEGISWIHTNCYGVNGSDNNQSRGIKSIEIVQAIYCKLK